MPGGVGHPTGGAEIVQTGSDIGDDVMREGQVVFLNGSELEIESAAADKGETGAAMLEPVTEQGTCQRTLRLGSVWQQSPIQIGAQQGWC